MEKPMNPSQLPQSDSIQELAQFWDSHDLTDFEGELEEIQGAFDRDTTITLRLPSDEVEAVRSIAKSQGLADAELIRRWIAEKVQAS